MIENIQIGNTPYTIDKNGYIFNTKTNREVNKHIINGRYYVTLSYRSDIKTMTVSRLLAESFIDTYNPNIHTLRFKDGNPMNICLDNIEVVKKQKQSAKLAEYYKIWTLTPKDKESRDAIVKILKKNKNYLLEQENVMLRYLQPSFNFANIDNDYQFIECEINMNASYKTLKGKYYINISYKLK